LNKNSNLSNNEEVDILQNTFQQLKNTDQQQKEELEIPIENITPQSIVNAWQ
jgi:hypothetical protein